MDINLLCSYCDKKFSISYGEYNRQIKKGREYFFCSRSCAAKKGNAERPNRRVSVEKICLYCHEPFSTMTGAKSPDYCSRSCASAGSVTDNRRNAQRVAGLQHKDNLILVDETLRRRELWKYKKLISFFEFKKENFKFEYNINDYVYDLALIERKIFIEFDAINHLHPQQMLIDNEKDKLAEEHGWKVIRKRVLSNTIIEPSLLYDVLK